jgi:Tfp pilus assembly protein PilF
VPNDIGTRKLLATTYLRDGQARAALDVLEPMLTRAAEDADVMRLVAEAYLATGNVAKGGQYYERANKLDKNNVGDKVRLAQVRLASGEPSAASRTSRRCRARTDPEPGGHRADPRAHAAARLRPGAGAIARSRKKQPDNAVTANLRGSVYMARSATSRTRAELRQGARQAADGRSAAYNLAVLDIQDGKADDARKRYEAMIAKEPKNEQLLLALAQLTALTRENPEEAKHHRQGDRRQPELAAPAARARRLLQRLKDTRGALSARWRRSRRSRTTGGGGAPRRGAACGRRDEPGDGDVQPPRRSSSRARRACCCASPRAARHQGLHGRDRDGAQGAGAAAGRAAGVGDPGPRRRCVGPVGDGARRRAQAAEGAARIARSASRSRAS